MAQVVKLKRTSVQGRVPTISNLELGELAINTHDGRIFFEKDNGELSIQEILTTNSSNSGSFNLQGAISASSLSISGDATIGGNLTLGGNITIGDETTDSINITAEFSGSLLPDGNEVYDLGSSSKKWNNIWVKDVNATNINSTTSIKTPFITGSLLRLSENGDGLRMTNIGAFDKDINNNFLIFSNQDLVFSTNGDSGVALTLDETTKDANFVGAVTASSFSTPLLEITSESVVRGYVNADEFGTYIISDGGIGLYTADGTDGVVIASDGDTTIYGSLTLQTIPLESTAVNAMVVGVGNTVSYRPLGSNAFSSENFLSVNGDSVISGSSQLTSSFDSRYLNVSGEGSISGSFTGSFSGDGSGLSNVIAEVSQVSTVTSSFDNQSSISVVHSFDSKNIIVSVYNDSDSQIIPQSVTLADNNTVDVVLSSAESGYIVVAKGGHIIKSSELDSYRVDVSGASSYAVSHSLDEDYPFVQAWNTDTNRQEQPLDVESTSPSSLTVTFSGNFTGKIIVKK